MNQEEDTNADTADGSTQLFSRLLRENELLVSQVAQAVKLNQEVLRLNHRLDQEQQRFKAMQGFIRKAVQAESFDRFPAIVCDSIIDLLECGVGMFWCLRCEQDESCLTQSGLGSVNREQWQAMSGWVSEWLNRGGLRVGVRMKEVPPLPHCIQLEGDFLVEAVLAADGVPLAVIFAFNTPHQAAFHDEFSFAADDVFSTFANQVGVLIESMLGRSRIIEQVEQIRISEERLKTALISSNVGLWEWDMATGNVFYSDQWKRQLGMDLDEVGNLFSEWSDRLHPDEQEHALQVARACAVNPGASFDLTVRLRHRTGRWLWIRTQGFNVSNVVEGQRRMIGTHIDVTDHKLLEEKLVRAEHDHRLARERAERESSAKSSFLASVSHEIRTPLNGMMAAFQVLGRSDDPEQRDQLIDMGQNAGKWMLKIIGEGLDISRIEAGTIELQPEVVNLRELLKELKEMKAELALERGLEFLWEVADDVPEWVMVDPIRLRQILANLLDNALKFTHRGLVSFKVTNGRRSSGARRNVRLSIWDSGIGFSKEFGREMFDPFTQASKKTMSGEHGIGLGLVITREFTRLMGGRIRVWSERGVGSRFVVFLPMEIAGDPGGERLVRATSVQPRFRGRVLLAEDDATSGLLGKMMLEKLGLDVDLAQDGGAALDCALKGGYDLIFMDCWMPVRNGLEVSKMIRSTEVARCREVPIIALTANAQKSDARDCLAAGMNAFMTKPLLFENLLDKLYEYLPGQTEVGS